jgi:deoxyribodipyrimidine photo-lyase
MLKGLECVEQQLSRANIPFHVLTGKPEKEIVLFLQETGAGMVVTDFDPIKIKRNWKESIQKDISIPFLEVDAHNIIPCWIVSPKREYAAYTIRPKIHRLLQEYLDEFPSLQRHPYTQGAPMQPPQWQKIAEGLKIDRTVNAVKWIRPGETDATASLHGFINKKIAYYNARRNDPSTDGQSGLSPYLHFGHIAPQRVALEIRKAPAARESRESFLEELIVRRELADNFCFYNNAYDRYEGFPDWAKTTLDDHRKDEREYIYSPERFEAAKTHDDLWNAAQTEMVKRGKMHGYMKIVLGKKDSRMDTLPRRGRSNG